MRALYVTSLGQAMGKSTLCAGIGQHLLRRGHRVGYLRPASAAAERANALADAEFFIRVLKLEELPEALCPLSLAPTELAAALADPESADSQRLTSSYSEVARDKEVMLLEGLGGLLSSEELARAAAQTARLLKAQVVALHRYGEDIDTAHKLLADSFGDSLLGVVINLVPPPKLEAARGSEAAHWESRGVRVLGILPQNRGLLTISVAELVHNLGGEVLNPMERGEGLVENVMVGAFTVDRGHLYYERKANKAVIVRVERTDMQMAALDTPTHCLILSGDGQPRQLTLLKAQDRGVPLMLARQDTLSIIRNLEDSLSRARFRQGPKLGLIDELLQEAFDFKSLGIS